MAELRRARVERLLAAARRLADGASSEGQALRRRLLETTGLSEAGIELAITHCLEQRASDAELKALLTSTLEAPNAHVLLSGNVFVAALRAIAIAAAASERVFVRTSRRDPALAEALHALTPESFTLVPQLAPMAGDRIWAYGSHETLAKVRASLPSGAWFHPHGHGFGVVVLDPNVATDLAGAARAIALDTALFDQRGCLSPRAVCVVGSAAQGRVVAQALAQAMATLECDVPLGPRSREERAEARCARDAATYAFETLDAGSGWVSLSQELALPPVGRNLHVVNTTTPTLTLPPVAAHITCICASVSWGLRQDLTRSFPSARLVALGGMQRPPLDGPVDRRYSEQGQLLGQCDPAPI